MVCKQTYQYPKVELPRLIKNSSYHVDPTNDLLTSRAGLLRTAQIMQTVALEKHIDRASLAPKSNRGLKPSVFINTLILMMYEGSCGLDDIRHSQAAPLSACYVNFLALMRQVISKALLSIVKKIIFVTQSRRSRLL